jgi:GNAT superfamily N-acetyltransferase
MEQWYMASLADVSLVEAVEPAQVAAVRGLFAEYARAVDEPGCFAGFERELAGLPGEYGPPHGRLLLARDGAAPAGCVGLRRLAPGVAEIKRLYVRPAYRATGLGRRLAEAAIAGAREAGCRRVMLDTLPKMREAIALYRSLGFRETAPYLAEPTPGSLCFELALSAAPEEARPAR